MSADPIRSPFNCPEVIAEKYLVERLVGVGGAGCVYQATHLQLDSKVAIKVLRPEMADRTDIVQRFAREARAAVRLQGEHIARVFDVGTHQNQPFLVMEFLDGKDLAEVMSAESLSVATIAELMIQTCQGLADAHAAGIIHRDIKPENLFIVRASGDWRTVKILDFGISKLALTGKISDVDLSSVKTEVMMGSPHYVSPEQIRSTRDVDHRTDLWSLGVVLYELLGGRMPFVEDHSLTSLIAEILEKPHRPLRDLRPDLPAELIAVVERCLEKDRDKRFQSAAELAVALLPFAPKRARGAVERALAVSRASGGKEVEGLLSSIPPPGSDSNRVSRELSIPGAAKTPSEARMFSDSTSPRSGKPPGVDSATFTGEAAPAGNRKLIVIGGLVLVGALGMSAAALFMRPAAPATIVTTVTQPATDTAPVAQPSDPARGEVTLTFAAKPSEAKLFLDDQPLPSNPYVSTKQAKDGSHHALRAEAKGYAAKSVVVIFDSDKEIVIALDKTPTVVAVPYNPPQRQSSNSSSNASKNPAPVVEPQAAAPVVAPTPAPKPTPSPQDPTSLPPAPGRKPVRTLDSNNMWEK